jgi:hypothetical protein
MKKLILITAFIILIPLTAQAEPSIVFTNNKFDAGEVKQGTVVEHLFEFTNKGTSELIIEKVSSS